MQPPRINSTIYVNLGTKQKPENWFKCRVIRGLPNFQNYLILPVSEKGAILLKVLDEVRGERELEHIRKEVLRRRKAIREKRKKERKERLNE